jgi:hypothetical protein
MKRRTFLQRAEAGCAPPLGPVASHGSRAIAMRWTQPADIARAHVEELTTSPHQYKVIQAGTIDGRNCRSPMGCGIAREGALLQNWESNRSARMENVGAPTQRSVIDVQ